MPADYNILTDEDVIENNKEITDDYALISILADQIVRSIVSLQEDLDEIGEFDSPKALELSANLKMFIDGPHDTHNLLRIYRKLIPINTFKQSLMHAKLCLGEIESRDEFIKLFEAKLLPSAKK